VAFKVSSLGSAGERKKKEERFLLKTNWKEFALQRWVRYVLLVGQG